MSEQHDKFLTRLENSVVAVSAFARHLVLTGNTVEMTGITFAESADQADQHKDNGDLFVVSRKRIEVKGISSNFTGIDDYPYDSIMFSSKETVEKNKYEVEWWVVVSNDKSHAAIIKKETMPHWRCIQRKISNTGNLEWQYVVDKKYALWRKLKG